MTNENQAEPGSGDTGDVVRRRTTNRTKVIIGLLTVLVASLLVWSFIAHHEAGDADAEGGTMPVSTHVANVDNEAAIALDAGAASRAGIVTAPLQPVNGARAGAGAATSSLTIQLQGELVADPARLTTIRAAVPGRLAAARWPALGEGVAAGRILGQVSDAKSIVAPRGGTVSRVSAQPGELVQAGQELLQLTDFSSPLVRVVWRTDLTASPPPSITVAPVTGNSVGTRAQLIGAASEVDSLTRMPVYLYRLDGAWSGARPGLPVIATIPDARSSGIATGSTTLSDRGVLVPEAAVVQWQALAWVYVERGPNRYVRTRVMTDHPVAGGYVVSAAASGLASGNRVVVRGAQQLLSEEFRTQLQTGDPDEKK